MGETSNDLECFVRDNLAQQLDALQLYQQQRLEPDPVVDLVRRSLSEGLERVAEACRRLGERAKIEVAYRTAGGAANWYDFGGFELIDVKVEPKESMEA